MGCVKRKTAAIAALLFVANAFVCWKLFFIEYLNQMGSIEGSFIAISRYAMENYRDMTWFPLWFGGMPYQNVYGPILHHFVALIALTCRLSAPFAFHFVTALAYCLGPVTLFWMAYRLTGSRAAGYWSALLYSSISPATLLIPIIRADVGGWFYLKRLHNSIVWGEQPHGAALALAPIVLVAIDLALRKRRPVYYVLGALALAVLALTNVTGSVGFAMMMAAYLLATKQSPLRAGLIALLAYGLAAPWMPPSTLRLISINSQTSAGNSYPFSLWHVFYFAALAAAVAGLWLVTKRWPEFLRFALFLTFISAVVVLPSYLFRVSILPQPERFVLESEMGCCLAIGFGLSRIKSRTVAAGLTVLCLTAMIYNRRHVDQFVQAIDIKSTSEYKEAVWFDQNMGGQRVFAPGSVSYWMNIFTDTPQLGGCCDQGIPHWQEKVALYVIYSGQNAGARDAEISTLWLQAYGVHAIGVSGPGSGEHYKPFVNPRKFDGVLRELWRDGGDVVYEVPHRSGWLAHVVTESQVVRRAPVHGLDVEPLRPFVAALNDPQLPFALMEWKGPARATIGAPNLRAGDLISVQVSYHPGWHAMVNGSERRIESDAIGLMVIHPECVGACTIDLEYDGGLEMKIARAVRILSLLTCVALALV